MTSVRCESLMSKEIKMILIEITVIIIITKNKWDRTFPQDYTSVCGKELLIYLKLQTIQTTYYYIFCKQFSIKFWIMKIWKCLCSPIPPPHHFNLQWTPKVHRNSDQVLWLGSFTFQPKHGSGQSEKIKAL